MERDPSNQRQFVRFNSNELDIALICLNENKFSNFDEDTIQFEGDVAGLVVDESFRGCSLVVVNKKHPPDFFNPGSRCLVKVGKQNPLQAEVKWRRVLDENIFRVGLEIFDFQVF